MHTYKVLMRKPECKKEHLQSGFGWEENIKLEHKKQPEGCAQGSSGLQQDPAMGFCEHHNEPPCPKNAQN
jgi:hypothetical protein